MKMRRKAGLPGACAPSVQAGVVGRECENAEDGDGQCSGALERGAPLSCPHPPPGSRGPLLSASGTESLTHILPPTPATAAVAPPETF